MVLFSGKEDDSTLLTAVLLIACSLDLLPHTLTSCLRSFEKGVVAVRVVKPNLLFCIHQRYSEGVCWGEGECRGLSRLEGVIGQVVWRYREEEVSNESIQEGFEEVEVVVR